MENPDGTFTCLHCNHVFARAHLVGRKPQYCSATCRQRAYEYRRLGPPLGTYRLLTLVSLQPPTPYSSAGDNLRESA